MSRLLPVIRREYVERVRSRVFLFATLMGPLFMVVLTIVPGFLMEKQRGRSLRIAVVDETGLLKGSLEHALGEQKVNGQSRFEIVPAEDSPSVLKKSVVDGSLDGYLRIPVDALKTSTAEYHGRNVSDFQDLSLVGKLLGETLVAERLAGEGIPASKIKMLTARADLKLLRVSQEGEKEDRGGAFLLAFVMTLMLYMTVAIWGQALMHGVVEEKANRIVEVMVASIPTSTLFAGKLIGVGAVGLTQFLIWAGCLVLGGVFSAPALLGRGITLEVPPSHVAALIVFFLLGYFLYAALYAAIGASVNTPQEAQGLVFLAFAPLIMAFVFCPSVLSNPEGSLSTVLSLIPPFTPILMFARIVSQAPPNWQVGLSIVLTLLTVVLVSWTASRIYRVGILMYGKRPTLPEILKWVRTS